MGSQYRLATIFLKQLYLNSEIIMFEIWCCIGGCIESNVKSFGFRDSYDNSQRSFGIKWENLINLMAQMQEFLKIWIATVRQLPVVEVTSLIFWIKSRFFQIRYWRCWNNSFKDIVDALIHVERIFVEYHSFAVKKQTLKSLIFSGALRLYMSIPGIMFL